MDLRAVLAGVAFALMWSSAFTSARIVVADAPPLTALAARFVLSGLLAMAIARALGQTVRVSRREWGAVILFGLCQNALYLGLNFVAMQWIGAGIAAIIASLLPVSVALAGFLFLRERLAPLGILGLAMGFGGVLVIMGSRVSGGADPLGLALLVLGLAALTAATLLVRDALPRGNLLMVVGLQMLVGAAALLPLALLLETPSARWSPALVLAFLYTTLVPGILATAVWFWLVRRVGATRAAAFHFLNPFLGAGIAALVLGESLTLRDAAGVAVIAAGILAVQLSRREAPQAASAGRAPG